MEWNKWNRLIDIECINYYFFIYYRYNTNTIHIYFFFLGWPSSWKYKFFLFDRENRSHRLVDVYRITVESMNFFLFVSMRLHIRCYSKLRVSFVFNINMDFKSMDSILREILFVIRESSRWRSLQNLFSFFSVLYL